MCTYCDFCGKRTKVFKCGYRTLIRKDRLIRVSLCQECIDKGHRQVLLIDWSLNE